MGRKRTGRPIHGWLALDKGAGMTSARAVAEVLRLTGAAKGGHGGTLDPLATGVLPIALGEATKTVAYVMDGAKHYRFTVRWGEARDTDDADGRTVATSPVRPGPEAIAAVLPAFAGIIRQVPPVFAAIKLGGCRAYSLARRGQALELAPREVRIDRFELIATPDPDHAVFELGCGKGAYVRALARDLANRLGTLGHVVALRRLRAGPFVESAAISLDKLAELVHSPALIERILPIETALDDIPALPLSEAAALCVKQGQAVRMLGTVEGPVRVTTAGKLVALAQVEAGEVRPVRVFNL